MKRNNRTEMWNIKAILISLSFIGILLMLCIPLTSAKSNCILTIDVIDKQTASVEIDMQLPVSDSTTYKSMVDLFTSEYEEGFKEGLEYLFDSEIVEYIVVDDPSTFYLLFDITLNGNYTSDFTIKEIPVRYTNHLPLDYDKVTVLKESSTITTITNYVFSMEYTIPLNEGVILPSKIAPRQAVTLPIENADDVSGLNQNSKFSIPDYWVGVKDDPVPETGFTASQVAEKYRPYFVRKRCILPPAIDYPDWVFYRVYKGDDPYTSTTNDAILIMYYGFWCRQSVPPHCNDAEPIYIWVNSIGEDPYKIAYDRWTFWDHHLHHVERDRTGEGATWTHIQNADYNHDEIENVYTQHASYFPQGRRLYNNYARFGDSFCQVHLEDITKTFDDHHLWLRIGTRWHTYDPMINDNDGTSHTSYTLDPLNDEILVDWYTTYACCADNICEFAYDVSDPFHGLFWEVPNVCEPKFPAFYFGKIKPAVVYDGILTVAVSMFYDNTHAGGFPGQHLRGMWNDNFNALIDSKSIGTPKDLDEQSAGEYILKFDVSGVDINSRLCLYVWDFFGVLSSIGADISIVDTLNILTPTQTAYQNVGAHGEPIKTNIEVEIKTSDDKFVPGLTIIKDYTVKIGDKTAEVIDVVEESNRYVLEIMPPKQAGDGKYDLHVGLGSLSDVENNAINYGTKGLDVALIIDSSGSMGWNDPQGYRKTAAKYFVDLANTGDKICVAEFGYSDCNSRLLLQLLEITDGSSRDTVKTAIDKVVEVGWTPIGGGLEKGYNELSSPRAVAGHSKAGILLTDGKDTCNTKEAARTYAQKFGDNGWFLYTIGLTGAADEDLLRELATLGNGEYYKAPTNEQLLGIYDAISGRVAGEQTMRTMCGTVQQGSTSIVNALIDSSVTKARFTISWAGSDLNLTLKKPDGGIIDPEVAKIDPNINYTSASSYEFYTVQSPMPGEWELRIFGADVPVGGEDYTASVMGTTNLTMNMYFDRDQYSIGEPIKVSVSLTDAIKPITGASVTADVELSPAASSSLKNLAGKDNLTEEEKSELANLRSISLQNRLAIAPDQITLFDDGMHNDGMANDGVYANFHTNTDTDGTYKFTAKATGTRSPEEFERVIEQSTYVSGAPTPDLSVTPTSWDITSIPDTSVEESFTVESSTNTIASISATDLTDGFGNVIQSSNFIFNTSILALSANEPQDFTANLSIPLNSPVGDYTGSIIITAPEGTLNIEVEITVISNPPIANANGPYAGVIEYIAVPITFDGTGSYDPDGTIKKYEWDLNDDGKFDDAFEATPTVSFTAPYSGNIHLKVTDNNGATDTDTTTLTITKHSPPPNGILKPPEQPQCYKGTSTIQGKGYFTIDESIQDWATAIDTTEHIEGTGEFAMDSKKVLNQAANPSDFYDPNFYYKKTMQFQGNATNRLISRDKFESSGIFGGTGTRINEFFDVSRIQKDESGSIKTISAPGSGQSHRFATMDDFSGIWSIHSDWQKICQKKIAHRQLFKGNFSVQKDLTFEREFVIP